MEALSLNGSDAAPPLARGRYRLLSELGHGGMATVYRGYDTRLSRQVAVKVLNPGLSSNAVLRARFGLEAKTMARLGTHPRVVQIYDFGEDEDDHRQFIAMELLCGTLQQVLDRHGPLPPRLAAEVMNAVLEALETAHAEPIVHRDVKPSNVLLTQDGRPKVGDFGIARIVRPGDQRRLTRTGAGVGTWAYMAPEQKRDAGAVDPRADLYGVGATLFALLTQQEPHDIDRSETWRDQLEAIPASLREIVLRATRYLPEERYQDAAEMRAALAAAREDLPPDPPGSEQLLIIERPPSSLPAPPTLVPDPRPLVQSADVPLQSTGFSWPPPEQEGRRTGLVLIPLVLLAVGVLWLMFRDPAAVAVPAPPVEIAAQQAAEVAPPVVDQPVEQKQPQTGPETDPAPVGTAMTTQIDTKPPRPPTGQAPEPPPRPPPVQVQPTVYGTLLLSSTGEGRCEVRVDGQPIKSGTENYVASKVSPDPISLPVGKHTLTCAGNTAQSVEVVEVVEGKRESVVLRAEVSP